MAGIDATEFATGIGLEELKVRMAKIGKSDGLPTEKDTLDKFFADQGHNFVNRDDEKILAVINQTQAQTQVQPNE